MKASDRLKRSPQGGVTFIQSWPWSSVEQWRRHLTTEAPSVCRQYTRHPQPDTRAHTCPRPGKMFCKHLGPKHVTPNTSMGQCSQGGENTLWRNNLSMYSKNSRDKSVLLAYSMLVLVHNVSQQPLHNWQFLSFQWAGMSRLPPAMSETLSLPSHLSPLRWHGGEQPVSVWGVNYNVVTRGDQVWAGSRHQGWQILRGLTPRQYWEWRDSEMQVGPPFSHELIMWENGKYWLKMFAKWGDIRVLQSFICGARSVRRGSFCLK